MFWAMTMPLTVSCEVKLPPLTCKMLQRVLPPEILLTRTSLVTTTVPASSRVEAEELLMPMDKLPKSTLAETPLIYKPLVVTAEIGTVAVGAVAYDCARFRTKLDDEKLPPVMETNCASALAQVRPALK